MKVRMTRTRMGYEAGDVFEVHDDGLQRQIFVDRDGDVRTLSAHAHVVVEDETPEPCGLSVDVMAKRLRKAESLGGILPCNQSTDDDLKRIAEWVFKIQGIVTGRIVRIGNGTYRDATPDEWKAIMEIV